MLRLKLVTICILIVFLFSGCTKSELETEQEKANVTTEINLATKDEIKLGTKDEYLNALYGYYEHDGYYYFISEDVFEQKNKTNGKLNNSGMLAGIEVFMQDDGVSFDIVFYRDAYPKVTMFCSSKGVISDSDGNIYKVISEKEYQSVEAVQEEGEDVTSYWNENEDYDDYGGYDEGGLAWHCEVFNLGDLLMQVKEIDNLLAVGKHTEANVTINEKIFGTLNTKVNELIKSREYWAAHNLIAMYEAVIMDEDFNQDFNFIEDYFEEEYTAEGAIVSLAGPRFSDHVQKYYYQLLVARKADQGRMDKQNCLYKMNEFLLQNGYEAVSGVFDDYHKNMYFIEFYDSNFDPTDYYIICPYTAQIRYLPELYYFLDDGHLYEFALKDYM